MSLFLCCSLVNADDQSAGSPSYGPGSSPLNFANLTDGHYTFSGAAATTFVLAAWPAPTCACVHGFAEHARFAGLRVPPLHGECTCC